MPHSVWTLALCTAALALLAWGLRRWQHQHGGLPALAGFAPAGTSSAPLRVLCSAALGPQQRVVLVQVGSGVQATRLLLGVTAQHIAPLHVLPLAAASSAASAANTAGNAALPA